jgi:NAD(P)-dependent dehydrogenase (short-subunit alcohol dehydrogenase family)
MFDVRDRVAFVTGAGAERESARLRAAGYAVEAVMLDVADLPAIRAAIDTTVAKHGRLDACFANAGISSGTGPFTEAGKIANIALDAFARAVNINLISVFATMQAAAVHMQQQKSGRIIVTASISGMRSTTCS